METSNDPEEYRVKQIIEEIKKWGWGMPVGTFFPGGEPNKSNFVGLFFHHKERDYLPSELEKRKLLDELTEIYIKSLPD